MIGLGGKRKEITDFIEPLSPFSGLLLSSPPALINWLESGYSRGDKEEIDSLSLSAYEKGCPPQIIKD